MLHIKLPACSSYFDQRAKCKMTGSCKIFLHKMEIAMSVLLLWRPVHYGYICWIQLNKTLTKNSVANKPRKQNLAKLTRKNFKTHSLGTRGMQKKLATSIPIVQWCGHVWKYVAADSWEVVLFWPQLRVLYYRHAQSAALNPFKVLHSNSFIASPTGEPLHSGHCTAYDRTCVSMWWLFQIHFISDIGA